MGKKIVPVVIAIIKEGNKFLLTKRKEFQGRDKKYHGLWQFPGGGINFGETPEQALNREMMEELGIEIKLLNESPKVMCEVRDYWQGIFLIYLARLKNKNCKIKLNKEASEYGWFSLEEIKKLKRLPLTYEACKEINLVKY